MRSREEKKAYNKRWRELNPHYSTNYYKMHYVQVKRRKLRELEKHLRFVEDILNTINQA